jgi:hypothetical protein
MEDGAKLVGRLKEAGFPVTTSAWIKESDGGRWHLYVVSPAQERLGPLKGYRRVLAVMEQQPSPFAVGFTDVKLIGTTDPVAKALTAVRDSISGRRGAWFQGSRLGELEIDAAYVYGPVSVPSPSGTSDGVP